MDVQGSIRDYINDSGAIGAAVGLIDRGEVSFFTYGKKSVHEDDPITTDTIFEIGSITKVFTTLALMEMVSKRIIQLDEPIQSYLPDIKVPEINGKKITVRHLATHTSGLPSLPDNFNPKNPSNPYLDYTIGNLYNFLNHHSLRKIPGEQFEYSNIGMGLLGHVLSLKAGQSYDEIIRNVICNKLGMNTTLTTIMAEMQNDFAKGHNLKQVVEYWNFPTLAGAGALRSNIKDMTQFLAINMGLSDTSVTDLAKQCHQEQYTLPAPTIGVGVGLGWMITHQNDNQIIWHNGGTAGFRTYLGFNPKTQKGIVILSNSSEGWPDELGTSVLDPDFKKPLVDQVLANNHDYLNKFEGAYEVTHTHDLSKEDM